VSKNTKFFILSILVTGLVHLVILMLPLGTGADHKSMGKVQIKLLAVEKINETKVSPQGNTNPAGPKQKQKQESVQSTGLSDDELNVYLQQFISHLEKFVKYPVMSRRLAEEDYIDVRFEFKGDGRIDFRITRRSQFKRLNDSVNLGLIKASPFPRPPSDFPAMLFNHRFKFQL
jgi:hypothetical protein